MADRELDEAEITWQNHADTENDWGRCHWKKERPGEKNALKLVAEPVPQIGGRTEAERKKYSTI